MRYLPLIAILLAAPAFAKATFYDEMMASCLKTTRANKTFSEMARMMKKDMATPYCECSSSRAESAFNDQEKADLLKSGRPSASVQQRLNQQAEACINQVMGQ